MPTFRDQRGMVTAEAALVLPLIAGFCLVMIWMLTLGIAQIRAVDAARDAARALARGEDRASALSTAARTAPAGARVSFSESAGTVTASVSARVSPPSWLVVPLPSVDVESRSTVEIEPHGDLLP
jgi:Flp pilus assembly protein TadG